MANIEKYWTERGSIFSNKSILTPAYMPEQILHRDGELKGMAEALRSLVLREEQPENIIVHGKSGLGKTISVRYMLSKIKERSNAMPIYINSWGMESLHQLLLELLPHFVKNVPVRGVSTNELFTKLVKNMARVGRRALIAFDEFDRFLNPEERTSLLYEFSRMDIKNAPGIIIIGSPKLRDINDPRVASSLMGVEVSYDPYSMEELKNIFKERLALAFRPKMVEKGVLNAVADFSLSRNSDVRAGLACMRIAGETADYKNQKLSVEHITNAEEKVIDGDIYSSLALLGHDQLELLYTLALNGEMTSGKVYAKYCSRTKEPISERSYRRYIEKLEKLKLIKTREHGKGMKGRTRIIALNVDPKEIKESYVKLLG